MKKRKKLVLVRETLATLENAAGGAKPPTTLPNTMVTSCDYTYSCPEWTCTTTVQTATFV